MFVEGAEGARTTGGGRGKRARRGQRATANTAAGDYVACRRGTVSSYPRRPPCSDWPGSLPRKRTPGFSSSLSLSLLPPFSSPLSSHPGPDSPSRFFESRSPISFFFFLPRSPRSRCPREPFLVSWSSLLPGGDDLRSLCFSETQLILLSLRFVHLGSLSSPGLTTATMAASAFRNDADPGMEFG